LEWPGFDSSAAGKPGSMGQAMRAYILINVKPGRIREVLSAIGRLPGVQHADACWGLPDVFAYVETPTEHSLHHLVMDEIQKLEGVERTETHIVVE
jgi:DNA-binding Lrp family transcriptional regulator